MYDKPILIDQIEHQKQKLKFQEKSIKDQAKQIKDQQDKIAKLLEELNGK